MRLPGTGEWHARGHARAGTTTVAGTTLAPQWSRREYTPQGTSIELGARTTQDHIELWVADGGPGLPLGHEDAIFNKFMRGNKESSIPGVGLGLAICRAIAQAHGGTILGATRPTGGACITLRLPRETPPDIETLAQQTDEQQP